jgi:hypothetical protein
VARRELKVPREGDVWRAAHGLNEVTVRIAEVEPDGTVVVETIPDGRVGRYHPRDVQGALLERLGTAFGVMTAPAPPPKHAPAPAPRPAPPPAPAPRPPQARPEAQAAAVEAERVVRELAPPAAAPRRRPPPRRPAPEPEFQFPVEPPPPPGPPPAPPPKRPPRAPTFGPPGLRPDWVTGLPGPPLGGGGDAPPRDLRGVRPRSGVARAAGFDAPPAEVLGWAPEGRLQEAVVALLSDGQARSSARVAAELVGSQDQLDRIEAALWSAVRDLRVEASTATPHQFRIAGPETAQAFVRDPQPALGETWLVDSQGVRWPAVIESYDPVFPKGGVVVVRPVGLTPGQGLMAVARDQLVRKIQ